MRLAAITVASAAAKRRSIARVLDGSGQCVLSGPDSARFAATKAALRVGEVSEVLWSRATSLCAAVKSASKCSATFAASAFTVMLVLRAVFKTAITLLRLLFFLVVAAAIYVFLFAPDSDPALLLKSAFQVISGK